MEKTLNFLSLLLLVSSFILVANKRINSYIRTFRMQSLLLAVITGLLGFYNIYKEGSFEIMIICLLTVTVKVVYIPHLLKTTVKKIEYKVEKDFFLNIPISVLICCGLVVLTYFTVLSVEGIGDAQLRMNLVNSISVILIGLFFMVSRKKAIGQIIGFLVMENGLFTAAVLSTRGMPMIVELGIFFDVLTAVLIMGILVFRINENLDSIDVNKLRNLRG